MVADFVAADSGAADPAGLARAVVARAVGGLRTGDLRTVAGFEAAGTGSAEKGEETAGSTAPMRASDGCPSGSEFGGAVVTPLTYQGQSGRAVPARYWPKYDVRKSPLVCHKTAAAGRTIPHSEAKQLW